MAKTNWRNRIIGSGTRAQYSQMLRKAGWVEQASNPKGRYVYILDKSDKALVARVERMRRPYPKRSSCETGEIDSAAQTNAQTGGASPTVSLPTH